MKDKLTPNVVAALAMLAVAAVALVGWFGLVSPQRSTASDLDRQIGEAQTQLAVAKATTDSGAGGKTSGASALALARAMPDRVEMAAVLRQLLRAANRTDVRLDSVTPQAAATKSGYSAVPMDVVVTGRYFGVQRFLRHLRTQAGVAGPHVHAAGRLFSVDSVSLAAGDKKLPQLAATIHLNVFTYSGSAAPPPRRRRPTPRPIPPLRARPLRARPLRARRLPPRGRTDEYFRDTHGRSPGRGSQCRPAQEAPPRRTVRPVGGAAGLPASEAAEELGLVVEHRCAAGHGYAGCDAQHGRRHRWPGGRERPGVRAREARACHPADEGARPVRAAQRRDRRPRRLRRPRPRLLATPAQPALQSPPPTALPTGSTPTNPTAGEPGLVGPAEPTAAVIWTNGKRQLVGVAQTFQRR